MRDVTLSPSRPASGESLIVNRIASVGGSTGEAASEAGASAAATVSATVAIFNPAIATMSPADTRRAGSRASR